MTHTIIPRWVCTWTHGPATDRPGGDLAPFVHATPSTDTERRLIRDAVTSQRDWHDMALRWISDHGFTYGDWMQAREAAQGLTRAECAGVVITDEGQAVVITARELKATPTTWAMPPNQTPRRPGRHSNSLSVTPETNEAPQGAP
jgi:hypothetical protein